MIPTNEESTARLFNNSDRSISYWNSAGVIKPQFLYELALFSYAGIIDRSTISGSLVRNKENLLRTLSESLKEADKLHRNPDDLFLKQSEFSELHKRAKSEHIDIFRGNHAMQAALSFIELTLCSKTPRSAKYNNHSLFDRGCFIFNKPESTIEEQPTVPRAEAQERSNEPTTNDGEPRPSVCENFLYSILSCVANIAPPCRRRPPPTRVTPADSSYENPAFGIETNAQNGR